MPTLRLPLTALLLLALPSQKPDDAAATARIESALKAAGLAFEKSASGLSFKLAYEHENGRSQTVYVNTQCSRPGSLLMHTIFTTVWSDTQNAPGEELMRKVLSRSKKLGSFYLFRDSQGVWAIRFGTAFDATDLAESSKPEDKLVQRLKDTIEFVDKVGEETDLEVNGEKDLR